MMNPTTRQSTDSPISVETLNLLDIILAEDFNTDSIGARQLLRNGALDLMNESLIRCIVAYQDFAKKEKAQGKVTPSRYGEYIWLDNIEFDISKFVPGEPPPLIKSDWVNLKPSWSARFTVARLYRDPNNQMYVEITLQALEPVRLVIDIKTLDGHRKLFETYNALTGEDMHGRYDLQRLNDELRGCLCVLLVQDGNLTVGGLLTPAGIPSLL